MHLNSPLTWTITLFLAWLLGEWLHRFRVPRILSYCLVGLALGPMLSWIDTQDAPFGQYMTNLAMGLALFEIGFRFNPMWIARNRWVLATSLVESWLTYIAVLGCGVAAKLDWIHAAMLASLCMATSPISVLRVTRDLQSSGQVTNLVLTLSALNSLFSILAFKATVGIGLQSTTQGLTREPGTVLMMVVASIALAFLAAYPFALVRRIVAMPHDSVAFTIALYVACITVIAHTLRLSPALTSLILGGAFRALNIKITGKYQDFGSFGRFGTLFLFVFVSAGIDLRAAWAGVGLGILVVGVRACIKIGTCVAFASLLGTSRRKGALAGLALMPVSVFGLIVLEQANQLGINAFGEFPHFASVALLLEIMGPAATQVAILWSRESND